MADNDVLETQKLMAYMGSSPSAPQAPSAQPNPPQDQAETAKLMGYLNTSKADATAQPQGGQDQAETQKLMALMGQSQKQTPLPEQAGRQTGELLNKPYNVIGAPRTALEWLGKAIGGVGGLANKAWGGLVQTMPSPMDAETRQTVSEAPKNALQQLSQIEQAVGETPLKKGILKAQGNATPEQLANPRYADIVRNIPTTPGTFSHGLKESVAEPIGQVAEPLLDPAFAVSGGLSRGLGGLTKEGLEAQKAGTLASTLGEGAKLGQRGFLTADIPGLGRKTILQGTPLLDAISKVYAGMKEPPMGAGALRQGIGKTIRGVSTETGNTAFDRLRNQFERKNSYSAYQKDVQEAEDAKTIQRHAALRGVPESDIHRQLNEYIEPTGTQAEGVSRRVISPIYVNKIAGESEEQSILRWIGKNAPDAKDAKIANDSLKIIGTGKATLPTFIKSSPGNPFPSNVARKNWVLNKLTPYMNSIMEPMGNRDISIPGANIGENESFGAKYATNKGIGEQLKSMDMPLNEQRFETPKEYFTDINMKNPKESWVYRLAQKVQGDLANKGIFLDGVKFNDGKELSFGKYPFSTQYPDFENKVAVFRNKIGQTLHPELKDLADRYIAEAKGAVESPGEAGKYQPREFYIKHELHPQLAGYMKSFSPETQNVINKATKGFAESRDLPYTINQINDLGKAGRLGEVPGLKLPELEKYKGPIFDEKTERLAAMRQLNSAKVNNHYDFMQGVSKLGTDSDTLNDMIRNGKTQRNNYIPFSDPDLPGKELYFPKEVGRALNDMKNVTPQTSNAILDGTKRFMHTTAFLMWPASFFKVLAGNQFLAASRGLWSPSSIKKSLEMQTNPRYMEQVVVNHPKLGPLTGKQVEDLAHQHGGLGMGFYRQSFPEEFKEWQKMGNEQFKPETAMQKGMRVGGNVLTAPFRKSGQLGGQLHNVAENITRRAAFINALEKGFMPEAAGKATADALFNYSKLGPANEAARNWFPFYTFFIKNLENNAKLAVRNPAFQTAYSKAQQERAEQTGAKPEAKFFKEYETQEQPWPGKNMSQSGIRNYTWLGNQIPGQETNRSFGTGKLPDVLKGAPANVLQQFFSALNPGLTGVGEEIINRDFFRKQPIHQMEGQVAPSPVSSKPLPWQASYLLNKAVRPYAEAMRMQSGQTTLPQKIQRLFLGTRTKGFDLPQAQSYWYRQLEGAKGEMDKNINDFKRQYEFAVARKDANAADAAMKNIEIAQKNGEKKMKELAERFR